MIVRQEEANGKELLTYELWWDLNDEKYSAMKRYHGEQCKKKKQWGWRKSWFLSQQKYSHFKWGIVLHMVYAGK